MNVYFYTTNPDITSPANAGVVKNLQQIGAVLYSNLEGLSRDVDLPKDLDALVVLGDSTHTEVAFVVALGIARQKPILYLFEKGDAVPEEVQRISESKQLQSLFKSTYFTLDKLSRILEHFFNQFVFHTDAYTIKFTLRLNSSLSRYLAWKAKKVKMTKATLVRKIVEEYKRADEKYSEQ